MTNKANAMPTNLNTLAYEIAKALRRKCLIRHYGGMDAALSASHTPQPSIEAIQHARSVLDEAIALGYTITSTLPDTNGETS